MPPLGYVPIVISGLASHAVPSGHRVRARARIRVRVGVRVGVRLRLRLRVRLRVS